MKRSGKKKNSIAQLFLLLLIVVAINVLGRFVFFRLDMTADKRYTLSEASKQLANTLDDIVYFKIYLEGDIPPGFNRLKTSTREILDEFRVYAGDNIEYEFIDPSASADEKERNQLYRQLAGKGLFPTSLEQKDNAGQSQKIIFPGAIVTYRSQEYPLQLLKSSMGNSPEQMLNNSIENLEYEITSMLRKITIKKTKKIGFLRGHDEADLLSLSDAKNALSEFYSTDTVHIDGQLNALQSFEAIIIAGPRKAFDENDKFIIDQYIMNGGKVFWLIDKMMITMDSLTESGTNIALANELNIDDMLFKYGTRINADLIMDLQAAPVPIVTGYVGNQPKQQLFPWYYFPLLGAESNHPIVNNLNVVKGEFTSSVDAIDNERVNKTVLLSSGKFSRVQMAPARVSLNILRDEPDPSVFRKKNIPAAFLLEGNFTSNYVNRIPESIVNSPEIGFKEKSVLTSMIVAGDADLILNHVNRKGNIYPLGTDRYTGQNYGNKNFLLNCIDYLCGNREILSLRSKDFKLRLLDPSGIEKKTLIGYINLLVPAALVLLFGLLYNWYRRKKYESRI